MWIDKGESSPPEPRSEVLNRAWRNCLQADIGLVLELVKDRASKTPAADEAKALTKYCFERGLILLSCGSYGNVIRLLMPLVIEDEHLEKGLAIVEEGLNALSR